MRPDAAKTYFLTLLVNLLMFYKEIFKRDERSPSSSDFKNWLDSNVYLKKPSNVYFLLYSPKWTNYHLLLELHLANHNQMLITPFLKLALSHERHHSATYPVGEVYNRLESISYHKIFYKKKSKNTKNDQNYKYYGFGCCHYRSQSYPESPIRTNGTTLQSDGSSHVYQTKWPSSKYKPTQITIRDP